MKLDETCELRGESMQSPFRKKIINILKSPYNQSEYAKLLKDVKVRKPIERNLELRNGRDLLCPTSEMGKSYLDHHKGKVYLSRLFYFNIRATFLIF